MQEYTKLGTACKHRLQEISIDRVVTIFHGMRLPEPAVPVGYAAMIDEYGLSRPPASC